MWLGEALLDTGCLGTAGARGPTRSQMSSRPHLVIDAREMLGEQTSGIGRYSLGIVQGIDHLAAGKQFSYSLLAPRKLTKRATALPLQHYAGIVPLRSPVKNLSHQILKRELNLSVDALLPRGSYYFPAFTMLPMRSRASAVVVHDLAHLDVPAYVAAGNVELLRYALPRSIRQAGTVIAVSEFTKQRIIHHFGVPPSTIHVVPPAVDRDLYRRIEPAAADSIRERYGIGCRDYLLAVGTLEPRKNLANLIDAFASLPAAVHERHSLVLIGANGWDNGATQQHIDKAVAKGARILRPSSFVRDNDMAAFYSGARGLAFVPHYEGFGIPPLEAYACGTPVLASRVASIPEAAGDIARYVEDPSDLVAIRHGLLELLSIGERERQALVPSMSRHLDGFAWSTGATLTVHALTGIPVESLMRGHDV
jgi:glycosyltransferase involved in cell wall biosynthesis